MFLILRVLCECSLLMLASLLDSVCRDIEPSLPASNRVEVFPYLPVSGALSWTDRIEAFLQVLVPLLLLECDILCNDVCEVFFFVFNPFRIFYSHLPLFITSRKRYIDINNYILLAHGML